VTQKNTTGTQGTQVLEESATQEDTKAMRELARWLMEGDGMDKDEAKAVSLLEDCVAHGDADAMMMLAKCCALGRGMEHNAERAEALVSDAAEKGNDEARILLQLINHWKWGRYIDLKGLRKCFLKELKKRKTHVCDSAERCVNRECTIERVALVMNIVPCRDLVLGCESLDKIITFF
jgi:TPR repeat protein